MQAAILAFLSSHPQLAVLVTAVVVLKAVFHPLMAVIENGVSASGDANAQKILNNVEASSVYKMIVWAIDYATSIDLSTIRAAIAVKSASK
jgi:hypothetical protein